MPSVELCGSASRPGNTFSRELTEVLIFAVLPNEIFRAASLFPRQKLNPRSRHCIVDELELFTSTKMLLESSESQGVYITRQRAACMGATMLYGSCFAQLQTQQLSMSCPTSGYALLDNSHRCGQIFTCMKQFHDKGLDADGNNEFAKYGSAKTRKA